MIESFLARNNLCCLSYLKKVESKDAAPIMSTPISHQFNLANGAKFADFNGWQMPTFYTSIIEEHKATREHIGLFDVSHMGRWWVEGKEAQKFLNHIITNDLTTLKEGRGLYTAMLNEEAGIIDDLIIYKINAEKFLLVNNAGNHDIDTAWYQKHSANFDVQLKDITPSWGQIAIQGPQAKASLEGLLGIEETLKYFQFKDFGDLIIAATGYTGEKGYELYGSPEKLMQIWQELIDQHQAKACGLGSRDLLRLEAGYCLHGNDIDTQTSPYEAGLAWVTKMDKESFIGKDAATRLNKKLVGLAFPEGQRLIPRHGTKVLDETGNEIGQITSGNYSQQLNRAIALAYIQADLNPEQVIVEIRNKKFIAKLGEAWFYRNIRKTEYNPMVLEMSKV